MHWRRLATFLLGGWLATLLFGAYIVTHLARTGDVLLSQPPPALSQRIQPIGPGTSGEILQYHAQEQIRTFVPKMEVGEILAGIVLTMMLLFATHANRLAAVLSGAMIVMTLFLHYAIFPEIVFLGRRLDFIPESLMVSERYRLTVLELTYGGIVVVKMMLGAALTGYLLMFKTRVRRVRRAEMNAVDNPKYRSVNG